MNNKTSREILCTLGPSSMNDKVIARLEDLGVSYFRINLSHTPLKQVEDVITYVQNRTKVPVCLDTEGAQFRTGRLISGKAFVKENTVLKVPYYETLGNSRGFNIYPIASTRDIMIGDFISIDFNSVLVKVVEKTKEHIKLLVITEGIVGQNKAVSVDRQIRMPALTEKDKKALLIGKEKGIKCVALSFANHASDVDEIKKIVGPDTYVISKIESRKGVLNLEGIARKSNALLLDRGDLSRQIPIEQIPSMQKNIIDCAKKINRKIYIATNLLESMVLVKTPTRAEVNDIFNTLADGADGLVLAAETAVGKYPIDSAVMISKIIKQCSNFSGGYKQALKKLEMLDSFLVVEPHGRRLIDRVNKEPDWDEIRGYKVLDVDEKVIMDSEQIALGSFSPIEGFMKKEEVESVLDSYRLLSGDIWTLPILLPVKEKSEIGRINAGDNLALRHKGNIYATVEVEQVYAYDMNVLSKGMFESDSADHPGVQQLRNRGEYFIGGKIQLMQRLPSSFKHFEITPRQARAVFESKGWSRIIGFHTRNVIHRAHEHIQRAAIEAFHADGLFLHPVAGPKKEGDYATSVILKSYEIMMQKFYPQGAAFMAAFQSYSRYSGPREAVFTALCRKNFGCSHFIVGRDHTGVGSYYKPDAAQKLFAKLGGIGIVPIYFDTIYYCKKCRQYRNQCKHGLENALSINGTQARSMFMHRKAVPNWFMRDEISKLILKELDKGREVFVK